MVRSILSVIVGYVTIAILMIASLLLAGAVAPAAFPAAGDAASTPATWMLGLLLALGSAYGVRRVADGADRRPKADAARLGAGTGPAASRHCGSGFRLATGTVVVSSRWSGHGFASCGTGWAAGIAASQGTHPANPARYGTIAVPGPAPAGRT